MAYYNTCIECGANLDPGEICDCQKEQEKNPLSAATEIRINGKNLLNTEPTFLALIIPQNL